jgi:hypothetical protein
VPLLDHFHPPVSEVQFWESFHTLWISAIVERLNEGLLPRGYLAQASVHLGELAVDVGAFERASGAGASGEAEGETQPWAPAAATLAFPVVFPDELEVRVYNTRAGLTLVAAIELVSPRNKDRPTARRTFAAKCVSYLSQGLGLIVVDLVTDRHFNLHDDIIRMLDQAEPFLFPPDVHLYAVSYAPTARESGNQVELWPVALRLGDRLPELPLALRGDVRIPIDLEGSYMEARKRSQL